ncbi:MAG: VWA domain-containing protein [Oscillospiraceae bacterium]|nr:VWA domain-containing protein [Oscillospiraceae bacterium]
MKKAVSILVISVFALIFAAGCGGTGPGGLFYHSDGAGSATDRVFSMTPAPSSSVDSMDSTDFFSEFPLSEPWYDEENDEWRYEPFDETDDFAFADESPFKDVKTSPLSTFSASVDTASYSIMRRQIMNGSAPSGMRIEELINYFDYDYIAPVPGSEHPFSVFTEISEAPWAPGHLLAKVGIQGKKLQSTEEIINNIVFLIDVSGSMNRPDRLPLVIESMKLLLSQLNDNDIISIVTYAGNDKVIADSVPGTEKDYLTRLLNDLTAGGSTAGARGLLSAYEIAEKNFIEGGNNRIILATDGDFNVGLSSVKDIIDLVEKERDKGIFISVLGYGMGNLKDTVMEAIATNGNGNYAYIDTIQEAKKVLVHEFDSIMFTIAKDVKFQVEFNPETISAYRLIGYDTRRLENEDFNDDAKDAGDIGSGHNVTAFFELIPVGAGDSGNAGNAVDPLRYSDITTTGSDDFMTVKIRYKEPDGDVSKLIEHPVGPKALQQQVSDNFKFASAVAEFGLIVTDSRYKNESNVSSVLSRAKSAAGEDTFGLRAEFLDLVRRFERQS